MGVLQVLQDGFHSVRDRFFFIPSMVVHPQMSALRDLPKIISAASADTERFSVDNGEFLVGGISSTAFIRGFHIRGVTHISTVCGANTRIRIGAALQDYRAADMIHPELAGAGWPGYPAGIVFEGVSHMANDLVGFNYQNVTAGDITVPSLTWVLFIVNLSPK